jgi:multidrug resistance efflux pump
LSRTLIMVGLALATGIWLTGRLEQRTGKSFAGRLQARMITIGSDNPARLKEIRVKTGQRVAAGDPLLVLETLQRQSELLRRKQELARREQEVQQVKAAADLELHWRRRELQAEIFQTQLRLASLRQEKLQMDVEQVAWREQLSVHGVFSDDVSEAPFFRLISDSAHAIPEERVRAILKEDAAATAAEALASQISLCERRLEQLRILDQSLDRQIRQAHGIDAAEERCRLAAEALAAEETSQLSTTVTSPSYGLIGVFRKQPGDLVEPGETLVQILDDDRRSIEVEVPSWALVHFSAGKTVHLGFPGGDRRTGIVSSIPPQTSRPDADATGDVPVRLTIEPSGKLWPMTPIGSRVLVYQP